MPFILGGSEPAAALVPEYVCAGSSVWVRGELEGHQLRGQLAAGLFNQPRATQQVTTEIREKGLLF